MCQGYNVASFVEKNLSEFLLGGMFLFQVILLAGNGQVFFNELIATIGEVRWPDAVFKASEVPHLVTSNVISLISVVKVPSCECIFVDHK